MRVNSKRAILAVSPLLIAVVVCGGRLWAQGVALPALPEGDGIAARYLGDKYIERDPAVLFADGFETTEFGPLAGGFGKQGGKQWDTSWGMCRVTQEGANVHSGMGALELAVPRPGDGGPGAAGVHKFLLDGSDVVFLRYYAKFGKDVEVYHGGAHNGGGIAARAPGEPQASAGVRADGRNKYTVVLDTWRPEEEVPSPGHLVIYCYHMDQAGDYGDQFFPSGKCLPARTGLFGEEFSPRTDFIPQRGRWYCYELMLKANTPGNCDGRVAFWVDGELCGDFPGLRFREAEELRANRVDLQLYTHHPKVTNDITMWYDDVVVATSYVGPQGADE